MRAPGVLLGLSVAICAISCGDDEGDPPGQDPAQQLGSDDVPNWEAQGFTNLVANRKIAPGQAPVIEAFPYTVQVPNDAFAPEIRFQVLGADPLQLVDDLPPGETPVLAVAFRVLNLSTGKRIGDFLAPVRLMATSPGITDGSQLYRLEADGSVARYTENVLFSPTEVSLPVSTARYAWLVTIVQPLTPPETVPDWTMLGFTEVLGSVDYHPGVTTSVIARPVVVVLPADAFDQPVHVEVLAADPDDVLANSPPGQRPVVAFALRVTSLTTGGSLARLEAPATATVASGQIPPDSRYYHLSRNGLYTRSSTGVQVAEGSISFPISSMLIANIVTVPVEQ